MGKLSSAFFHFSQCWLDPKVKCSMSQSAYNLSESLVMLTFFFFFFFANECKVILAHSICLSRFYPTPRPAGSKQK